MRLLIAALLLAPALASADDAVARGPDANQMHADDCARARKAGKTCVLDMGGEDIEGPNVHPPDITVGARAFAKSSSLIHIRKEFIVEILKSSENID